MTGCNELDDIIRCQAPPPNLNSANSFYVWVWVKLPNSSTVNIFLVIWYLSASTPPPTPQLHLHLKGYFTLLLQKKEATEVSRNIDGKKGSMEKPSNLHG